MFWKIVLVLGILGIVLGFCIAAVSAALPSLDSKIAMDEAVWGIIAGVVVLIFSFFVFLLGLIFVIVNRRKKAANPQPGNMSQFG